MEFTGISVFPTSQSSWLDRMVEWPFEDLVTVPASRSRLSRRLYMLSSHLVYGVSSIAKIHRYRNQGMEIEPTGKEGVHKCWLGHLGNWLGNWTVTPQWRERSLSLGSSRSSLSMTMYDLVSLSIKVSGKLHPSQPGLVLAQGFQKYSFR